MADSASYLAESSRAARRHINIREKVDRIRVLVIGRANAAKTTVLTKIWEMTDSSIIFNSDGKRIDLDMVKPTMVYEGLGEAVKSQRGFIFHDSRGFEAGSADELREVQNFMAKCSQGKDPASQVHVIWYCISLAESRPLAKEEISPFLRPSFGRVPVVPIFTKYDLLENLEIQDPVGEEVASKFCGLSYPHTGQVYLDDAALLYLIEKTIILGGARLNELGPPRSTYSIPNNISTQDLSPKSHSRPRSSSIDTKLVTFYKRIRLLLPRTRADSHSERKRLPSIQRNEVVSTLDLQNLQLYPSSSDSPISWLSSNRGDLLLRISASGELDAADRVRLTDWVNKGVIYERCMVYIFRYLRAQHKRHASGHLAEFIESVQSWINWDTITALHNHQTIFERLQTFHPLWNEDLPKKIIALDIDSICVRLHTTLHEIEGYKRFVELAGEQSQKMLNLLQMLLDSPSLHPSYRPSFTHALLKLSRESCLYPENLLEVNVTLSGDAAISGGQFGDVWKGTLQESPVAVKVLRSHIHSNRATHLKEVLSEMLLWRQLKHPNVLPFLCVHYVNNNPERISLVSPWMENGNVHDFLRKNRDADRVSLVRDITEGLDYLHTKQPAIIHGDLKSVNILVTDAHRACLADFGISAASDSQVLKFLSSSSRQIGGTTRWTAPELFKDDQAQNDRKSDIYAFGCVCYEIFSGDIPFPEIKNDLAVIAPVTAGRRPVRPTLCSPHGITCASVGLDDKMWSIIELCWTQEPSDRPATGEVLAQLPVI